MRADSVWGSPNQKPITVGATRARAAAARRATTASSLIMDAWLDPPTAVRLLRAATIATSVTASLAWLDGSLFAWHPVLMTVGLLGCATEAALTARTARALEPGPARVAALWRHACWAGSGLACLAAGGAAIFAHKVRKGKHHLHSTHARVGAAAGVAAVAAGLLGPLAFRSLGLNARLPPAWQDRVKVMHRVVRWRRVIFSFSQKQ